MKVNVNKVMEVCNKGNFQQVVGCLNESVLLYIMGIVEFPEIGAYVNLAGEEDRTCEVLVLQVNYLHGQVYVEYKRKRTVYVNEDGEEVSWHKEGYKPIDKWVDAQDWVELNRIIIR